MLELVLLAFVAVAAAGFLWWWGALLLALRTPVAAAFAPGPALAAFSSPRNLT